MLNIHIINDIFSYGSSTILLEIIEYISILLASLVIITKNPVQSVIFLIGLFSAISIYLISIGVGFIGLSYLLVYVGAVSILFLFILMLINIRTSELVSDTRNSLSLVLLVSVFFGIILQNILSFFNTSNYVLRSTNIEWDNSIIESSHISSIGNLMYTNYFI
jgi:NADH-ubiquinone oxidoreductase chain 6